MGLSAEPVSEAGWLKGWPLIEELTALVRGRLCGPAERRRCRAENGPFAAWACRECTEFLRPEAISPWTWHLLWLHRLRRAGYPFRANDLSLETWLLLGLVGRVMDGGKKEGKNGHGCI